MEKREKLSRLASLQKLKKKRNKESISDNEQEVEESQGNEFENGNEAQEAVESEDEAEYEEEDEDDLKDFIENDEEEEEEGVKSNRRVLNKFFKTETSSSSVKQAAKKVVDKSTALKDDFFKNLVAELSDESDEEGEPIETAEPIEPADDESKKRKGNDGEKKKRGRKSAKTKSQQSEEEAEYVPTCGMSVEFPEPAPINQLEINNAKAMEIDEEAENFDFPDEADLEQFEEEMSFILENQSQDQAVSQTQSQGQAMPQSQPQIQVSQSSQRSFGLVASAEEFMDSDKDGSCLVYWFDAYERQPNGPVYLFGKMKDSKSSTGVSTCCVVIENLQRNLFFLPRETSTDGKEVSFEDLQAEVGEIASQYGISRFGCKKVTRKYAFELPDVPAESEYLKMVYPYNSCPQLPLGLSGRTFSHVFGTNTSALEMLLVKRKIMGPCWLKITPSSINGKSASWCRTELTVTDPKQINPLHPSEGQDLPPPPLMTAMSLSLRTVMNPETKAHEIVSISGLIYDSVDIDGSRSTASDRPQCTAAFTVVRDLHNEGFSNKFASAFTVGPNKIRVEQAKNEKSLLNYFVAMLQRYDPDILVGHNFLGFDLSILLNRMKACKVDSWSRIGRLNWTQFPKSKAGAAYSTESSYAERQILCGRIVCDTYLAAKDLIKAKNYSLGTLAESQLGLQREPFDYERIREYFETPELLRQMLSGNEMDAYYIAMLMFQMLILPLTLQLTTIAGNLWSRTLTGARAERNEFLLLHEFHNQKFICPDKQPFAASTPAFTIGQAVDEETAENGNGKKASTSARRKPAYSGGLVLEPKKGFYDRIVLLLDFNSLYPSIIQEYNICFTTVDRDSTNISTEEQNENGGDCVPAVPESNLPQGVLPRILKTLVERRRAVKSLMKKDSKLSPAQLASLNIRQQALKLTANSMYGCLGFSHSRFYAKPLAILITSKGREILQNTVNLTREVCQSDVIYGDTDSIMVNTRSTSLVDARALGQKIKKAVNERYRLLEIELDGIFQKLLLLKKKKYAALIVEEERADGTLSTRLETKGLDLVRRDWCELSVEASTKILDEIMRGGGDADGEEVATRIHECLRKVAEDLRENRIPLEKFIISKNLTKEPSAYADAKTQPHVTVALRMRKKGLTASSGDTIPYVICQQHSSAPLDSKPSNSSLADYAYHPDEVRKDATLKLDTAWYLQTQLHPPIARLCEHIEGTDSSQLAACLGLDPKKFKSCSNSNDDSLISVSRFASLLSEEERFASVDKLKVSCPSCAGQFEFLGITKIVTDDPSKSLMPQLNCSLCSAPLSVTCLYYATVLSLQKASETYNAFWMKCDEVGCQLETERLGVYDRRCPADGCKGVLRPLLSPAYIYTHLLYLKSLFCTEKAAARVHNKLSPADTKLLHQLKQEVGTVMSFIESKMKLCAYPIIDFKQIFGFLNPQNDEDMEME